MSQEEMKFKVKAKIKVEKYPDGLTDQQIKSGKHQPYEIVEIEDDTEMTKAELEAMGYTAQ